ncbi:protein-L-isoaspartate(D-aspartate) O-methyltransferase [Halorussus halobius]|uniref:protein-L-isoaspartate(D-aspartate) O-methyltransferase n=1 Tax=Halorussus halobius TaxID=1710537 RepID=UPI001092A11F
MVRGDRGDSGSGDRNDSRDGEGNRDAPNDNYQRARERMVDQLARREEFDESTLDALRAVPRHEFVPPNRRDRAYEDRPLPIGSDQTISAPHMVAMMVDLLDLDPGERVLEVGTGCGYHAAATAEVVGAENVYSVEYHDSLAASARERLADLGYGDVSVRVGDGREGWPEPAPYDAAYLTCAARAFPEAVVEQVRPAGRLLAPLETGDRPRSQRLVFARRRADGSLDREPHGRVRFVPMQGD